MRKSLGFRLLRVLAVWVATLICTASAEAKDATVGKDWPECLPLNADDKLTGALESERLPGPAGTLQIALFKPGLDFKKEIGQLSACVRTSKGYRNVELRDIESNKNNQGGSADQIKAVVVIPGSMMPDIYDDGSVMVALGTEYIAQADFRLFGTFPAVIVAILVLVVGHLLVWLFILRKSRSGDNGTGQNVRKATWLDWFTGAGQKPSLSLFQIYIWTWLVITGSAYVAMLTGDLLPVTGQVLALLGIAGVGSVAARLVAVAQDRPPETTSTPKFNDILKTDGAFDLYKLQMFLFTVGVAAYVAVRIIYDQAFPTLEENLLLLLGISNGIYVGSKVAAGASPFQLAEQLDVQMKLLDEAKQNAEAKVRGLQASVDATNASIAAAGAATSPQLQIDLKLFEEQLKEAQNKLAELQKSLEEKTKERAAAVAKLK